MRGMPSPMRMGNEGGNNRDVPRLRCSRLSVLLFTQPLWAGLTCAAPTVLSIVASIYPYPALVGWANVCRAYGAGDSFRMTGARGAGRVARPTRRLKKAVN